MEEEKNKNSMQIEREKKKNEHKLATDFMCDKQMKFQEIYVLWHETSMLNVKISTAFRNEKNNNQINFEYNSNSNLKNQESTYNKWDMYLNSPRIILFFFSLVRVWLFHDLFSEYHYIASFCQRWKKNLW